MSITTKNTNRLWLAGAIVVIALGFLAFQALGEAALYFRTADEAVAQRESLGSRRFRIQGTVVAAVTPSFTSRPAFDIVANDVTVPVVHQGDPPELFQPGIPVVLEGRFQGQHFASDRILVKHSETYTADHPDRVTTSSVPGARPS